MRRKKVFSFDRSSDFESLLARVVKCQPTLQLAAAIIDASNAQEEISLYFPGDDLFTPHERRRGLPLGNQTSQFFANVYLNPLDHLVNRELRPAVYVRYVDDFLLFDDSQEELGDRLKRMQPLLGRLRLELHARKSRVYRTRDGVTCLGWRIFPNRIRLVRDNVIRFRRRLRRLCSEYEQGKWNWKEIDARVRAWMAHAAHGNTWKLREQIFSQHVFRSGRAV